MCVLASFSPLHVQRKPTAEECELSWRVLYFYFSFKAETGRWVASFRLKDFISCCLRVTFCCRLTGDLIMKLSNPISPKSMETLFPVFVFPPIAAQCCCIPNLVGQWPCHTPPKHPCRGVKGSSVPRGKMRGVISDAVAHSLSTDEVCY